MTVTYIFTGKRVLVTGGTRGIGLAIAQAFKAAGADVHVTGTRASLADYDMADGTFSYAQLDVEDRDARAGFAENFGDVDVLVHNAGGANTQEYSLDGFARSLELNLLAVMDLSLAFHERLKGGGRVVNIGSAASFLSIKNVPGYTAAKTGLLGLTRALADQWAPEDIRVNMIAPGFIKTDLTAGLREHEKAEAKLLKAIPMERWGHAQEIADAVLFLSSDASSYITGQSLIIDGGMVLR